MKLNLVFFHFHFHKTGFSLSLVLKASVSGLGNYLLPLAISKQRACFQAIVLVAFLAKKLEKKFLI